METGATGGGGETALFASNLLEDLPITDRLTLRDFLVDGGSQGITRVEIHDKVVLNSE